MTYDPGKDLCLGFWATHWNAGSLQLAEGARVLEIGSAEADWITPMQTERPDLEIRGIDVRDAHSPQAVKADVLTFDFPEAWFDAIVAVSAIEHIGLAAYGDPVHQDGDTVALTRAASWLKPGGWMYFDVPYAERDGYRITKNYRRYDDAAIQSRLTPPGCVVRWAKTITCQHADSPYVAVVLDKI
jgi:cyclopropane fatty-acyl-phospholipid synthase-like methyltransferase